MEVYLVLVPVNSFACLELKSNERIQAQWSFEIIDGYMVLFSYKVVTLF